MAHVISVINLKGGVGKTTTTVALADVFSAELDRRVLVIDQVPPPTGSSAVQFGLD